MNSVMKFGLVFVCVGFASLKAATYGRLVNIKIENPSLYTVKLRDIEGLGGWITQDGKKISDIENRWFTLNESSTDMSLIVPWEQWDNHDIAIQVFKKGISNPTAQVRLQDLRDSQGNSAIVIEHIIGNKPKESFSKMGKYCKDLNRCDGIGDHSTCEWYYREVDVDLYLIVRKDGAMDFKIKRSNDGIKQDGRDYCQEALDYARS